MNAEVMDTNQPQIAQDPDIVNSEFAMLQAAQLARRRAWQSGIGVIVMKDGKIVEEMQDKEPGVDEGSELPGR
jgi:hypothetical protein